MARYFFHLRNDIDDLHDAEGADLTLEQARSRAFIEARALIADEAKSGAIDLRHRIDVARWDGFIVFSLPFRDAVEIV